MSAEQWRPIEGFLGYFVSDQGRVRSERQRKPRIMKLRYDNAGYPYVGLSIANREHIRRVHRLVAVAFHGAPEDGQEVRHLNDVKTDNRAVNLAWGSPSENMLDRVRNGIHPWASQTHCARAGHEFTEDNIYRRPSRPNSRACRACHNERTSQRYHSRKAAA